MPLASRVISSLSTSKRPNRWPASGSYFTGAITHRPAHPPGRPGSHGLRRNGKDDDEPDVTLNWFTQRAEIQSPLGLADQRANGRGHGRSRKGDGGRNDGTRVREPVGAGRSPGDYGHLGRSSGSGSKGSNSASTAAILRTVILILAGIVVIVLLVVLVVQLWNR